MGAYRKAEYVPLASKPTALRPFKQSPGPFLADLKDLTPAEEVPARIAEIRARLAPKNHERSNT